MAGIVVIGAGIGGISQVYELRQALGKEHEIALVGESDRFKFTPSNPCGAVGWRKEQQIALDLPNLISKYGIAFSSWASRGKWVHLAKIACEEYFLHKVRAAKTEPNYKKAVLKMAGAMRSKGSQ